MVITGTEARVLQTACYGLAIHHSLGLGDVSDGHRFLLQQRRKVVSRVNASLPGPLKPHSITHCTYNLRWGEDTELHVLHPADFRRGIAKLREDTHLAHSSQQQARAWSFSQPILPQEGVMTASPHNHPNPVAGKLAIGVDSEVSPSVRPRPSVQVGLGPFFERASLFLRLRPKLE